MTDSEIASAANAAEPGTYQKRLATRRRVGWFLWAFMALFTMGSFVYGLLYR